MSLRFRLLVSISLGLLASLGFGGILAFWHAGYQVQTEMRSAIAVGEHIARNIVPDSEEDSNRRQRLQRLIAEFDGNRHLQAFLVNGNNDVLLASEPRPPDDLAPEWFRYLLDRGSELVTVKLPAEFGDNSRIVLATNATNEIEEAWSDIRLAMEVLVAFSTFVLGIVGWTLTRGLRPLQDLNVAFIRVGRGDYTARVDESGPTDLKHLAREFNQMVARLAAMRLQTDRLNHQLGNLQEQDRADLARELHDEIGPFLFAVGLDVSTIQQMVNADSDVSTELPQRLSAIRDSITHMQKHLKVMLGRLRPAVLLDLGLAQAVDNLVDFWKARHSHIIFDVNVHTESFGELLDECIYRIVRESLSNSLRHGNPSKIDVSVCLDVNTVAIEVCDDGGGMRSGNAAVGFGIIGMRERVAPLGGELSVHNRDGGQGVVVTARLPLKPSSNYVTELAIETVKERASL